LGILLAEVGVMSGEWLTKGLETPYQRIGNRKGSWGKTKECIDGA
jgi:hypothetical protein